MSQPSSDDQPIARALRALDIEVVEMLRPRDGHSAIVRLLRLRDGTAAVLKIPSSDVKYRREVAALAALAGHLPVPELLATRAWHDGAAILLERLPGEPLAGNRLTATAMEQIGRSLARLHEVPVPDDGTAARTWEPLLDPLLPRLAECRAAAPGDRWDDVEEQLARLSRERPALSLPVRAHFDPLPANFLFEGDRLTGVIDFESSRIAPPEVDLALLANGVSAGQFDSVLSGYETVRPRPVHLSASLPALRVCGALAAAAFSFRKGKRASPFIDRQLANIDACLPRIGGS